MLKWTRSAFIADVGRLGSGTILAQVLLLSISPLLSRLFSPAEFGVFAVVISAATLSGVFASLCLEMIVPVVRRPAHALRLVQLMVLASLSVAAAALLLIALAQPRLDAMLGIAGGGTAMLMLPVAIIAYASYAALRAVCLRRARFTEVSTGQMLRAVGMSAVWLGLGAVSMVKAPGLALALGQAVGDATFATRLWRALTRRERRVLLTVRFDRIRSAFAGYARQVAALVASQAISVTHGRIPLLVIAAAYGPVHAGWYALAERVASAPTGLICGAIGDVYRQRATECWRAGRPFDGLMRRVLLLTASLSVVPFAVAIYFAPAYTGLLLGQQWQEAGYTFAVMFANALVAFSSNPVDKSPIIVGANRYMIVWQSARLVAELVFAACALLSIFAYEQYLVATVAARCMFYAVDTIAGHIMARGRWTKRGFAVSAIDSAKP